MDKQSLIEEDDLPVRKVETPEWKKNPVVYVRMLDGPELIALAEFSKAGNGDKEEDEKLAEQYMWRFAAYVICNEDGLRMFTNDELSSLSRKKPNVIRRLVNEAQDHNGMTVKSHKAAVKNSEEITGDDDT